MSDRDRRKKTRRCGIAVLFIRFCAASGVGRPFRDGSFQSKVTSFNCGEETP
jgi:hypothetical protein